MSPPVYPASSDSYLFFARNIVIIIAIMFFTGGALHFLLRLLMKKIRLHSNFHNESTMFQENGDGDIAVYQRQLQQLFNIQDSGLDQSSIDALPVFVYKELVGLKESLHCAVCLCEFIEEDNLRLLPVCSHAFHTYCIDTWLLSNSTCPLCRGNLFTHGLSVVNPVFDFDFDIDFDHGHDHARQEDYGDHEVSNSGNVVVHEEISGSTKQSERVYSVRLGRFRAVNGGKSDNKQETGQTSNGNLDERRCYSMGSYEYVVGNSDLQVAFCCNKGSSMRGNTGNGDSRIEKDEGRNGKQINDRSKGESFSVSKIWLWSKKDQHKFQDSSRSIWSNPLSM
nr:RING-H2 finger protein ATL46-like [Tanacetum cinerariifolium]